AHYLEVWSEGRSYDGTASVIQPMIMSLYDGKNGHELLAMFTDQSGTSSHDLVQTYWKSQHPTSDFETFWRTSVHDGFVAGSASPARQLTPRLGALPPAATAQTIEVSFRPDPTIYDGTFINNAW